MPVRPQDLVIYRQDECSAIASYRNLYISLWNGPFTVERLTPSFRVVRDLKDRYGGGFGALAWVGPKTPVRMDAEVRKTLETLARTQKGLPKLCEATVIEGSGFLSATARAVLAGMHAVIGVSYPREVFSTFDRATRWVAPLLGAESDGLTPAEIMELMARLKPAGPP